MHALSIVHRSNGGNSSRDQAVPVVIVGGGPVGLVAALELARHKVRCLLVERHDSTTWHPKARNLNTRTMEIARGWGREVHDGLCALNLPRPFTSQIIYVRTALGEELGRMATAGFSGPGPDISPEVPLLSSQDVFEPVLRRGAEASGLAELRFGHEAEGIESGAADDDQRVVVTVRERATGRRYSVGAEYLLAADGAASAIRSDLGIELDGPRGLGHFVNVYFRCNLDERIADRPAILYWVSNGNVRGALQPLDARGRWLCQIAYDGTAETLSSYNPPRCIEWIRAASGDPSLTPDILSISHWSLNAVVARQLMRGRVLLIGDAAHQLPPIGGFGVNTGIQGVHNLAWKLALVRAGLAGRGLLTTYEVERRAVAGYNAERSLENSRMVARISAAANGEGPQLSPAEAVAASRRYGNFLGMELGYRYESSAVVPDGSAPEPVADEVIDYLPRARPGHRAPHLWLERAAQRCSTLDLFGASFTLVSGERGGLWQQAASAATSALGLPIAVHLMGTRGEWQIADRDLFKERYGIDEDGAVLVRPDGHVAFRASTARAQGAARDALIGALRQVLSR